MRQSALLHDEPVDVHAGRRGRFIGGEFEADLRAMSASAPRS